jgi:hypothetical protein
VYFFPTDLGNVNEKCGEKFHQDNYGMKKISQVKSNSNLLALKWKLQVLTKLNQVERDFEHVKRKYIF